MSFLAPLFLLGGLAVALPVVFHLVRRSSREKFLFSSLMFLRPTPPRLTRRNRLEHLLLLLLRCLVIGLLAFAFARPFLSKPMAAAPATGAGAQIVLLVDTSASMKREGVWPAALEQVADVVKKASPADRVAVLTFNQQVRQVISFDQWAAMNPSERTALTARRLSEIQPTWFSTHLGNALLAAAEALEDAGKREVHAGPRRIVLVTDLQEGSRLDGLQGYEWPRNVEVVVESVKPRRPTNAGLQWVSNVERSGPRSSDFGIRIRVSNSADANREQFQVRWAGLDESASMDAYVPPGQSRVMPAPVRPTNPIAGKIVLTGDDEAFDNQAWVVEPAVEEINVLYLGGDPANDPAGQRYYLERAFQDTRHQTVRLSATPGSLATNRLVVVAGTLSEDRAGAVRQYLIDGGTILLVMIDSQTAKTLGQLTGIPEVIAPEASIADYAMFGSMDSTHPLLAPFTDPRFGDFTKIRFWKHRRLSEAALPEARMVARFDDDDPAILEMSVGRGRLFLFTFSWRPADSQFALSSKFVPLFYSLLELSGDAPAPAAQYRVGDSVDLSFLGRVNAGKQVSVRKPDATLVTLPASERQFKETDQPGIYEVVAGSDSSTFVVNLDARESQTAPLTPDQLERLGVPMSSPELPPALQQAKHQSLHRSELEARQKLWRWLIVAALAVLLVETWLAGRITRPAALPNETAA